MNNIVTRKALRKFTKAECFEQGRLFEEYIKNLFNQDSFKIKKWRRSRLVPPDTFIGGLGDPDLELIFVGKNQYPFAVECKWKSYFYRGRIDWARPDQIQRYLEFERKRAMPVFIAIGIGGSGNNPERLFVTPLCNLSESTKVYEHQLIPYKRKPTHRFFYDTVQLRLW
jgi:hypothetical protein